MLGVTVQLTDPATGTSRSAQGVLGNGQLPGQVPGPGLGPGLGSGLGANSLVAFSCLDSRNNTNGACVWLEPLSLSQVGPFPIITYPNVHLMHPLT